MSDQPKAVLWFRRGSPALPLYACPDADHCPLQKIVITCHHRQPHAWKKSCCNSACPNSCAQITFVSGYNEQEEPPLTTDWKIFAMNLICDKAQACNRICGHAKPQVETSYCPNLKKSGYHMPCCDKTCIPATLVVVLHGEVQLPTRKTIGEWVKCPLCGKKHIYQFDHREDRFKPPARKIGKCECNPDIVIATSTILRDDGKVSVINEQELP